MYTLYIITIPFCVADVDKQLMTVANIASCPEYERYVVVLMDEMHIKSDLVYDKHSGTNLHYSITIPMQVYTYNMFCSQVRWLVLQT